MGKFDELPDVRDGLTRPERIVLFVLHEAQGEMRGRPVPTAMIYGRVCEHLPMDVRRFQKIMQRLVGTGFPDSGASRYGHIPEGDG